MNKDKEVKRDIVVGEDSHALRESINNAIGEGKITIERFQIVLSADDFDKYAALTIGLVKLNLMKGVACLRLSPGVSAELAAAGIEWVRFNHAAGRIDNFSLDPICFIKAADYEAFVNEKWAKHMKSFNNNRLRHVAFLEKHFEKSAWGKILDLTNKFPNKDEPERFSEMFIWGRTKEGADYWDSLNDCLLKGEKHYMLRGFEWVKDHAPSASDADSEGNVARPQQGSKSKFTFSHWDGAIFKSGLPWARADDCSHFTADYPAPSPFR